MAGYRRGNEFVIGCSVSLLDALCFSRVNGIKLEGSMGLVVLIVSILAAPGWSTVLAGFLESGRPNLNNALVVGILQVVLLPVLVGYIWAIMSAWKIYNNSK